MLINERGDEDYLLSFNSRPRPVEVRGHLLGGQNRHGALRVPKLIAGRGRPSNQTVGLTHFSGKIQIGGADFAELAKEANCDSGLKVEGQHFQMIFILFSYSDLSLFQFVI